MLLQEVRVIAELFHNLLQAFPLDQPRTLKKEAFEAEIQSLWEMLSLYQQRESEPKLANDSQNLTAIILTLCRGVKERIFSARQLEYGKRGPESGLETLLWTSGYFGRLHTTS
ncbi:MAG: hypothetical protein HC915_09930 [Anaerolineae bacterium]|nr:hypothetical protein [Anaerolineae bacterium]